MYNERKILYTARGHRGQAVRFGNQNKIKEVRFKKRHSSKKYNKYEEL